MILPSKDIFDFAKNNDSLVVNVIDEFSTYLGLSFSQLANDLNPDYIITGGEISAEGEYLVENVNHFQLDVHLSVSTRIN
ncbi:ROK family protein [Enterococcus faecalis]|uniref:ROK family protein n=1 Tax=Enterococcus faecalis TaxID=1351 RepID=UPI001D1745D0|nr:ROK family protein [Enterococcus faecalis]MCC4085361.1 ROK family protein [Enterococcus faecalis]